MMAVEARQLQTKDLFAAARIFKDARADVLATIAETKATNPEATQEEMGFALIFGLLNQADTSVRALLSDIAQRTPEQFDVMPLTDLMSLIEQIVGQEDWSGFLGRLSTVVARSNGSLTELKPATGGRTRK